MSIAKSKHLSLSSRSAFALSLTSCLPLFHRQIFPLTPLPENIYASIPNPTRGKPTLLGGDPKGDKILYCVGPNVVIRSLSVRPAPRGLLCG